MNPFHVPIVGSGFDAVAGQVGNWANFNRGVDEGNISRLGQQQQGQNAYLARVAEMARQDAELDHRDQQYASEVGRSNEQEGRRRFEWGQTRQDTLAQQSETNARAREQLKLRMAEVTRQNEAADRGANFALPDIQTAGDKMEASRELSDKAARDLATAISREETKIPAGLGGFNRQSKRFEVSKLVTKPEDVKAAATAVAAANAALENSRADAEAAAESFKLDYGTYAQLQQQMGQFGLQVGKRNGKYVIYNPLTGKTVQAPIPVANSGAGLPRGYSLSERQSIGGGLPVVASSPVSNPFVRPMTNSVTATTPPPTAPLVSASQASPPSGPSWEEGLRLFKQTHGMAPTGPAAPAAPRFSTKEEVISAFKSGTISRDIAAKLLNEQFGIPYK